MNPPSAARPDIPLVGTFDLHGNISRRCVALYDFMCCVHLYPHTDAEARGLECMAVVPRLLDGSLRTAAHLEAVPTLLPLAAMCTHAGFPAGEMNEFMYELEKRPGLPRARPYAAQFISLEILHTKYTTPRLSGSTAHG